MSKEEDDRFYWSGKTVRKQILYQAIGGKLMKENVICIEKLRLMLEKHRKEALKVLPTRTIFIDPLLEDIFSNLTDLYTTLYEFFRYCNVIKQPFIHKRIL